MTDTAATTGRFRTWMVGNLARAAEHFGLFVAGEPVFGWWLRSISALTRNSAGTARWLRVGTERESDLPHPCWDGLPTANAIAGVAKPTVLDSTEWDAPDLDPPRRVRADVMTVLPGEPCSPDEVLRGDLDLPDEWWDDLRRNVLAIGKTPAPREFEDGWSPVSRAIRDLLGDETAQQTRVTEWEAVHGDLHWNNVLAPQLGILDWEMWSLGPAGTDAASLYCHSLLVPDTARRVYETFADVLDSPTGRAAQIRAAARLSRRAPTEYPELVGPIQRLINHLR